MDREIAPELIRSRQKRRRVIGAAIVLMIVLAVYLFNRSLGTSVELSRIRIATVETGDVDNKRITQLITLGQTLSKLCTAQTNSYSLY